MPGPEPRRDEERSEDRPFSRREIWALISAAYRTSLPYVLLFVAALILATWLFTEVLFG